MRKGPGGGWAGINLHIKPEHFNQILVTSAIKVILMPVVTFDVRKGAGDWGGRGLKLRASGLHAENN